MPSVRAVWLRCLCTLLIAAPPGFLLQVAREAVLNFKPDANIVAHHANIKQPEFDVKFFERFDVVLNGLDNLDARRHVNRLCLAAHVPLVDSGTAGYLGQVWFCFSICPLSLGTGALGTQGCPLAGEHPPGRDRVLRVPAEAHAEDVPCVHHPEHA